MAWIVMVLAMLVNGLLLFDLYREEHGGKSIREWPRPELKQKLQTPATQSSTASLHASAESSAIEYTQRYSIHLADSDSDALVLAALLPKHSRNPSNAAQPVVLSVASFKILYGA
jgi:hypothetical protein